MGGFAFLVGRGLSNTARKALNRHAFEMGAIRTYAQTYAYAGATLAHSPRARCLRILAAAV
jgi:hypothetical protein